MTAARKNLCRKAAVHVANKPRSVTVSRPRNLSVRI